MSNTNAAQIPILNKDRLTLQLGDNNNGLITADPKKNWLYTVKDLNNPPIVITIESTNSALGKFQQLNAGSTNQFTLSTIINGKKKILRISDSDKKCNNTPFWDNPPKVSNQGLSQWYISGSGPIYYGKNYQIYNAQNTVYLQSTSCCDGNGNPKYGSIDTSPEQGKSSVKNTCGTITDQFKFFNQLGSLPTKPTTVLCCTKDPSLGDDAESFCKGYWGTTAGCDSYMTDYCKNNTTDPACACINSGMGTYAVCYDQDCVNSGYKPKAVLPAEKNCGKGCPTIVQGINSGKINQTTFLNSNLCTYCGKSDADKVNINCSSSNNILFIIIGLVVLFVIIFGLLWWIFRRKNNDEEDD